MYRQSNLILALAVGLLGAALVLAQTSTPAPKEIRAQSFVLVDDKDEVVGTFKPAATKPGQPPTVVFLDRNGHEIWRAGVALRAITER
jgi:hypothetical protein